ncbi:MAG: hypothetical protein GDA36_02030 [Rhodobacteraceae bacterium]|nr:hypothetical protein [Paracoccaceae bacterium]
MMISGAFMWDRVEPKPGMRVIQVLHTPIRAAGVVHGLGFRDIRAALHGESVLNRQGAGGKDDARRVSNWFY